jgi:hypothetical protein
MAVSSVLCMLSRRQDCYDERGIASSGTVKLNRSALGLKLKHPHRRRWLWGHNKRAGHAFAPPKDFSTGASSLQANRTSSVEPLKSFQLKRAHRRIRQWAVLRVLGTLSRRRDCYDERGVASSDKDKHRRAAQELPAQAPMSVYSAMGTYQACSARCRAVTMVMTSAVSPCAIVVSFIELLKSLKLKRPHRRIRPWGCNKRARNAAAPPR